MIKRTFRKCMKSFWTYYRFEATCLHFKGYLNNDAYIWHLNKANKNIEKWA